MSYGPLNIPCITCQTMLSYTLRPTKKKGIYYCTKCEACYQHIQILDIFGNPSDYLDPITPGRSEYARAADDGVNYEQYPNYNTDSTMPPGYLHDHIMSVPPPQLEHLDIPDFEEEKEIIKKSQTVKEFLKNSLYLEKPYDKD